MRSEDPFDDGVSDLVVDGPVVGAADEELILSREEGETEMSFSDSSFVELSDI